MKFQGLLVLLASYPLASSAFCIQSATLARTGKINLINSLIPSFSNKEIPF